MKFAAARGNVRIAYDVLGTGDPPVILLHDFGQSSGVWHETGYVKHAWLAGGRSSWSICADLDPEQRAALLESAQGTSFDGASSRRAHRSIGNHPTPGRAGMSAGGTRFHAARGGGRGGRRR